MVKKIFVGNLPFGASEEELRELFKQFGPVQSAAIITDRDTGKSRGFGFVEIEDHMVELAISSLNGTLFGGRTLRIGEAREKIRRSDRYSSVAFNPY